MIGNFGFSYYNPDTLEPWTVWLIVSGVLGIGHIGIHPQHIKELRED